MRKADPSRFELKPDQIRWICDPARFDFETTADLEPLDGVIGQKRATEALELGLNLRSPGYHIYACGGVGTGKMSTVKRLLRKLPKSTRKPDDIVYLYNFKNPKEPIAVKLNAGEGNRLKKDMRQFVVDLLEMIPNLFDNKEFKGQRDALVERFRESQKKIFRDLENEIKKKSFAMVQIQIGQLVRPAILPVIESQPVAFEQLEQLAENGNFPQPKLDDLKREHQVLHGRLESAMKESRGLDRKLKDEIVKLERDLAGHEIDALIGDLRETYPSPALEPFFTEMKTYTLDNLNRFKEKDESEGPAQAIAMLQGQAAERDNYMEWDVNVLVDNSETEGPVVIVENTPTYRNLFGTIEKTFAPNGNWFTDFTKIRAGSILRADGGFLVFHLLDALTEPGVWKALKRTIKSRQVEIESYDSFLFYMTSSLKPQGIDVDVKLVVIGDVYLYHMLYAYDEDFKKMFKVRADFDHVMPHRDDSVYETARFVSQVVRNENLPHFDRTALAAVVEECVSMAGQQNKLTTKFSVVADIVRETAYWAVKSRAKVAKAQHVLRALEARKTRSNLIEEKLQEMIDAGKILISTGGAKVGQINGLAVYQIGDYNFGKPTRITAKIGMGRAGIINIEREAKLSGKTYDKGLFILNGFLRERFSMDKPMTLSASVAFEQSYGGVDGDSASSTETYALLSAIADIPLDQSIAVTGSINQNGEIQPIGGVNEKIEGYFLACKAKKLTGRQGVIIPVQNVSDLMLSHEVVEAVRRHKFHIWAVSHIDEGMEVLTGIEAGARGADGKFPEDTLNGVVDAKLFKFAKDLQDFGKEKKDEKKSADKKDAEVAEEETPKESEDRKSGQKRRTGRRR